MALSLLASTPSALADPIDLSHPHGSGRGCAYMLDMQYSEAFMVLLTATEITTAVSLCTFTSTRIESDGSLKLAASCAEEGEAGEWPARFTIRRGDKPDDLVILDGNNEIFAEVSRCR